MTGTKNVNGAAVLVLGVNRKIATIANIASPKIVYLKINKYITLTWKYYYRDMICNGGPGLSHKACIKRVCTARLQTWARSKKLVNPEERASVCLPW